MIPVKRYRRYLIAKYINPQEYIGSLEYENIHIMPNDKFSAPFINLINESFDSKKHGFVICGKKLFPMPKADNVFEGEISTLKINPEKTKKIILHSLFTEDYFYHRKDLLSKCYWAIYGWDLYNYKKTKVNNFVRTNVKAILSTFDYPVYKKLFNIEKKNFFIIHKIPTDIKLLTKTTKVKKDFIQIQINNSSDRTTIEILKILHKFKNENIKINTILSYGNTEFNKEILDTGNALFGCKFEPITTYMTPQEYSQHMRNNDILILNQNRQQGMGNVYANLYFGNKVFMNDDLCTYKKLSDIGIKVFKTKDINNLNYKEFITQDENEKTQNQHLAQKLLDDKYIAELWREVFKDE